MKPEPPLFHHLPVEIAPDTWIIRHLHGEGAAPDALPIHSVVLLGEEPVVVDTGAAANRESWMADLFDLVEPDAVRWIFLTHDDADHAGNLLPVLESCPRATLVTTWFHAERLATWARLPKSRCRWVNDGEDWLVAGSPMRALRPPVFDSPATRGLYDPGRGLYCSADAFGARLTSSVVAASELDPDEWQAGLVRSALWIAPWVEQVETRMWNAAIDRIAALDPRIVVPSHGPVIAGDAVASALSCYRDLAGHRPPAAPADPERMADTLP